MGDGEYQALVQRLAEVEKLITQARSELNGAEMSMGKGVWEGGKADKWREGWKGRKQRVQSFLNSAQAECERLKSKAKQD